MTLEQEMDVMGLCRDVERLSESNPANYTPATKELQEASRLLAEFLERVKEAA